MPPLTIGASDLSQPAQQAASPQRTERFLTLLRIYDALLGSLAESTEEAEWASRPDVAAIKWHLEHEWLTELRSPRAIDVKFDDPVEGMRKLAARTRIPAVYVWVAEEATREQLSIFLAAEGGPDGGFDDLVAVAQVGLEDQAKLELATNYWDEMGNGKLADIHTSLHRRTSQSLQLSHQARHTMTEAGLERAAFGGLLATNHWLQPEMLGVLGMIELQAGPRCQQVLKAMRRINIPHEARTFYEVHAEVDPRHGADWLSNVIGPISERFPAWRDRMLRGAQWRLDINDRFLAELHRSLCLKRSKAA